MANLTSNSGSPDAQNPVVTPAPAAQTGIESVNACTAAGTPQPLPATAAGSSASQAETLWKRMGGAQDRWTSAIYICLLVFAAVLPHSKAATQIAYSVALVLWLAKLVWRRQRPVRQPLTPAMLAVLLLSAVSCLLSPAPALSWGPMKSVALLMVAVLVIQNVHTPRQIRTLLTVLLASALGSVGYTAWQYAHGIGAKIVDVPPESRLSQAGVLPGDIILIVDGHRVRTPGAVLRELDRSLAPTARLRLGRGEGLGKVEVQADRRLLRQARLSVGRPPRALGGVNHAVTYALVLLQIAALAWGLLLSATLAREKLKWALLAIFVLLCAAMGATGTRASLASLGLAGIIVFWMAVRHRWARTLCLAAVLTVMLAASLWIRHTRGLGMVAPSDDGTRYRVLMWQDGLRLTLQHPFFGIGMDTIQVLWPHWDIHAYRQFPAFRTNFHSTLIQTAAERGLLTLAAYVWLMFLCVRLPFRLFRLAPAGDWVSRGIGLGALGAVIGFLSTSLVNYNGSEMHMLFWFFVGITVALSRCLNPQVN